MAGAAAGSGAGAKAVHRIGFAYNPTSDPAVELRERAAGWAQMRGLDHWAAPAADREALHRELPGTDVLVVLGGDGTFLRAARAVIEDDVPLLGINVGKVGFLSKVEASEIERVLEQLVDGRFVLEPRMALEGHIFREGSKVEGERLLALNDIVIARGSLARVVRLDTSIDSSHLASFVADGLVVASPTGSTGYSFSAGGPILGPTARNLVVTPIAGYLTTIRSVVVGSEAVVRCRVVDAHEALVSVDGREDIPLAVGDVVEVRAIDRPVQLVEPEGSMPFWDLVRQKVELLPS
jgi:NAD+ kinase